VSPSQSWLQQSESSEQFSPTIAQTLWSSQRPCTQDKPQQSVAMVHSVPGAPQLFETQTSSAPATVSHRPEQHSEEAEQVSPSVAHRPVGPRQSPSSHRSEQHSAASSHPSPVGTQSLIAPPAAIEPPDPSLPVPLSTATADSSPQPTVAARPMVAKATIADRTAERTRAILICICTTSGSVVVAVKWLSQIMWWFPYSIDASPARLERQLQGQGRCHQWLTNPGRDSVGEAHVGSRCGEHDVGLEPG
jgi:hypothetical protein